MLTAGATAVVNCSLCGAGTYQTGSGQDSVMAAVAIYTQYPRTIACCQHRPDANMMLPAGATAVLNCSLCGAGTYQTGSGPD